LRRQRSAGGKIAAAQNASRTLEKPMTLRSGARNTPFKAHRQILSKKPNALGSFVPARSGDARAFDH